MYQCEDHGIPCLENDYHKFDDICKSELIKPILVDEIVNKSKFCTAIAIDILNSDIHSEDLSLRDYLSDLNGKTGVYHLWIEVGNCQDHELNHLLCVYVGKGIAINRITQHIKEKWPQEELLYVTFYECENRLSKYLEQLFLDSYKFYLNKDENTGKGELFARWDEFRTVHGTGLPTL
jgi:hypothetical protein